MKFHNCRDDIEALGPGGERPRRRTNLNLHEEPSDPINRFLNAGLLGTYVRPHRHRIDKWELLNVLQGRLDVVIFTAGEKLITASPLAGTA